MKSFKLLIISIFAFALLVGGLFTIQTQASTIQADVRCLPFTVSLDDPAAAEFKIIIELPKQYDPEDIDPESLLVGEVVEMMEKEDWPKITKKTFSFKVDGEELMNWVILPRIWHMAPDPRTWVDIDITVTGELYSGATFEGMFTMRVRTENPEPNSPAPP